MEYQEFLEAKAHDRTYSGFDPEWLPDFLFPHQRALVEWACQKGKAAIFADCGMGKTPIALVWAENIVRRTLDGARDWHRRPLRYYADEVVNDEKRNPTPAHHPG